MKKLLCIALSLLLLLSLPACSKKKTVDSTGVETPPSQDTEAPLYELYYAHGSQFLTVTKEGLKAIMSPEALNKPELTHSSVSEMKEMIASGKLPVSKLRSLCRDDGGWRYTMKIFDLEKLYDVVLPANEELSYITWGGDFYIFHFGSGNTIKQLTCVDEHEYKSYWAKAFEEGPDLPRDIEIISDQQVSDRNARVIRYHTLDIQNDRIASENMVITYQITVGQDIRYVVEHYTIGTYSDEGFAEGSRTVPTMIDFCGTSDGACFTGQLLDPSERPSVEWYSEIGLRKYSAEPS